MEDYEEKIEEMYKLLNSSHRPEVTLASFISAALIILANNKIDYRLVVKEIRELTKGDEQLEAVRLAKIAELLQHSPTHIED